MNAKEIIMELLSINL